MKYDVVFSARLKKLENDNRKFLKRLSVLENNVSALLDDAFDLDFPDLPGVPNLDYLLREYLDFMELKNG